MKAKQEELKKVHKGKWIPNALTISRLVIAVAIVIVLLVKPYEWHIDCEKNGLGGGFAEISLGLTKSIESTVYTYVTTLFVQFYVAGGLFVLGCITDFLDGFLSRKYNWVSKFGKIMDPVADKVLVDATLIILVAYNLVYVWIVVLLIARDILVDATRMVKATEGKVVPANIWGKCKTVFEMLGILLFLFFFNRIGRCTEGYYRPQDIDEMKNMYNPATAIANIGLYLALIFSIVSGVIYEIQMLSKPKIKQAK